jgi:CheY-like chemotaxis protein
MCRMKSPHATPLEPVILVVEGETAIRRMLELALRRYGLAVRVAATGEEAVEVYRKRYQDIALVLIDVQLPGMDGAATLAAIQQVTPGVRACFMSGSTGKYSTKELLDMGAAHVVMKPFVSLNLLSQLLWDIIGQKPAPV